MNRWPGASARVVCSRTGRVFCYDTFGASWSKVRSLWAAAVLRRVLRALLEVVE